MNNISNSILENLMKKGKALFFRFTFFILGYVDTAC
jgi:hypothetical protein